MKTRAGAIVWAALAFFVSPTVVLTAPDRPTPKPLTDREWHNLVRYHRDQLTVRRADICLLGDSLTEFWNAHGKEAWAKNYSKLRTVNCGIAADRVEHILYRAGQLDFAKARPHQVILLAGTNNLAAEAPDSPDDVARGCAAVIALIRKASPETKIVLLSIPPNGIQADSPLRQSIRTTNRLLATVATNSGADFLDIYPLFVDEHDGWRAGMTLDGTHFSPAGYAALAAALRPLIGGDTPQETTAPLPASSQGTPVRPPSPR